MTRYEHSADALEGDHRDHGDPVAGDQKSDLDSNLTEINRDSDQSSQVLAHMRRIIRAIDLDSHRLDHRFGVTTPQLVTLRALSNQGDLGLNEVAKAAHVSPSTMVGIVDRLEERGHVQRKRDTIDRRRTHIQLTASGRALLRDAPRPLHDALSEKLAKLSPTKQRRILEALETLTELMGASSLELCPILPTDSVASALTVKEDALS